jgi:hypothetical protein
MKHEAIFPSHATCHAVVIKSALDFSPVNGVGMWWKVDDHDADENDDAAEEDVLIVLRVVSWWRFHLYYSSPETSWREVLGFESPPLATPKVVIFDVLSFPVRLAIVVAVLALAALVLLVPSWHVVVPSMHFHPRWQSQVRLKKTQKWSKSNENSTGLGIHQEVATLSQVRHVVPDESIGI